MIESDNETITKLYRSNEYIDRNPNLHAEESDWKVSKIIPLIDAYIAREEKAEINLLDVGGGAGIILGQIADYISRRYGIKVSKYILDLSPGMVEVQKRNNPDAVSAINEDIRQTSLKDKQIDLTLMIDVIEHVPEPSRAIVELKRISRYAIFKVPLGDNLEQNIHNTITSGKVRKREFDDFGHINFFSTRSLIRLIETNGGSAVSHIYTQAYEHYHTSPVFNQNMDLPTRIVNRVGRVTQKLSPGISSYLLPDFIVLLAEF